MFLAKLKIPAMGRSRKFASRCLQIETLEKREMFAVDSTVQMSVDAQNSSNEDATTTIAPAPMAGETEQRRMASRTTAGRRSTLLGGASLQNGILRIDAPHDGSLIRITESASTYFEGSIFHEPMTKSTPSQVTVDLYTSDRLRRNGLSFFRSQISMIEVNGSSQSDTIANHTTIPAVIYGHGGDDVLIAGKAGYDVLVGGDGNDDLRGVGKSDFLIGGPGDDELHGGNDGHGHVMRGDDGRDKFFLGRDLPYFDPVTQSYPDVTYDQIDESDFEQGIDSWHWEPGDGHSIALSLGMPRSGGHSTSAMPAASASHDLAPFERFGRASSPGFHAVHEPILEEEQDESDYGANGDQPTSLPAHVFIEQRAPVTIPDSQQPGDAPREQRGEAVLRFPEEDRIRAAQQVMADAASGSLWDLLDEFGAALDKSADAMSKDSSRRHPESSSNVDLALAEIDAAFEVVLESPSMWAGNFTHATLEDAKRCESHSNAVAASNDHIDMVFCDAITPNVPSAEDSLETTEWGTLRLSRKSD